MGALGNAPDPPAGAALLFSLCSNSALARLFQARQLLQLLQHRAQLGCGHVQLCGGLGGARG
jgi:hypothetical protein